MQSSPIPFCCCCWTTRELHCDTFSAQQYRRCVLLHCTDLLLKLTPCTDGCEYQCHVNAATARFVSGAWNSHRALCAFCVPERYNMSCCSRRNCCSSVYMLCGGKYLLLCGGKTHLAPCTVSGNVNLSVGLLPGLFLCRLCGVKVYTVHFWIRHVVARFVLGSRFIFDASDAIDHSILFTRLEYTFGIHNTAFAWFKSCQRHAVRSCQIILWCPSRFCSAACSLHPLYYPFGLHHQPSQTESSLLCWRHSTT